MKVCFSDWNASFQSDIINILIFFKDIAHLGFGNFPRHTRDDGPLHSRSFLCHLEVNSYFFNIFSPLFSCNIKQDDKIDTCVCGQNRDVSLYIFPYHVLFAILLKLYFQRCLYRSPISEYNLEIYIVLTNQIQIMTTFNLKKRKYQS